MPQPTPNLFEECTVTSKNNVNNNVFDTRKKYDIRIKQFTRA